MILQDSLRKTTITELQASPDLGQHDLPSTDDLADLLSSPCSTMSFPSNALATRTRPTST